MKIVLNLLPEEALAMELLLEQLWSDHAEGFSSTQRRALEYVKGTIAHRRAQAGEPPTPKPGRVCEVCGRPGGIQYERPVRILAHPRCLAFKLRPAPTTEGV